MQMGRSVLNCKEKVGDVANRVKGHQKCNDPFEEGCPVSDEVNSLLAELLMSGLSACDA